MTNTEVTITSDGIHVRINEDDEPGSYVGIDAPDWLIGGVNTFVGTSFAEAKEFAMTAVADVLEEVQATFDDLEGLR